MDYNRLINEHNRRQSNTSYQNNALLNNNPMFTSNMSYQNSMQMKQMQQMQMIKQAQMRKLQEQQNIRRMEAINQIENNLGDIRDILLKPEEVKLTTQEKRNIEMEMKKMENEYDENKPTFQKELRKEWQSRTNNPYKNIIKESQYIDKFLKKENLHINETNKAKRETIMKNREKDLIVHTVTDKDRMNNKQLNEATGVEDFRREKHNKELKSIYSLSKENEHKQKFHYEHVTKFAIPYRPSDHKGMKKKRIKYLKKKQRELEEGKEQIDVIYNSLISDGTLDEKDKEKLKDYFVEEHIDTIKMIDINNTQPIKKENTASPSKGDTKIHPRAKTINVNKKKVSNDVVKKKPMRIQSVKPVNQKQQVTNNLTSKVPTKHTKLYSKNRIVPNSHDNINNNTTNTIKSTTTTKPIVRVRNTSAKHIIKK